MGQGAPTIAAGAPIDSARNVGGPDGRTILPNALHDLRTGVHCNEEAPLLYGTVGRRKRLPHRAA